MSDKTWIITVESIHNWRNRAEEWEGYYSDLPPTVHDAIGRAHDQHHRDGAAAGTLVRELIDRFSCLTTRQQATRQTREM